MHRKTARKGNRLALAAISVWAIVAVSFFGVILPAHAATAGNKPPHLMSCTSQLKVIRDVSRQAGITVGSVHTSVRNQGTPRSWAAEFRAAGLRSLAKAAAAIHSAQTDRAFVTATTVKAGSLLTSCQHNGAPMASGTPMRVTHRLPAWAHWRPAKPRFSHPCVAIWGRTARYAVVVCDNGQAYADVPHGKAVASGLPAWVHWHHASYRFQGANGMNVWGYKRGISWDAGCSADVFSNGFEFTSS